MRWSLFESEEAATSMSQQSPNMVNADVTLESVEVRRSSRTRDRERVKAMRS